MKAGFKAENNLKLSILLAGNFLVCLALINDLGSKIQWKDLSFDQFEQVVPVGLGVMLVAVLNALVSPRVKAMVVYLKLRHPLPGSDAFSQLACKDDRVNLEILRKAFGELPTAAAGANSLWYSIFRQYKDDPSVYSANKSFVLLRDCAVFSVAILLLSILGLLFTSEHRGALLWMVALGAIQFLLFRHAAANEGRRLVVNVLAIASAEESIRHG